MKLTPLQRSEKKLIAAFAEMIVPKTQHAESAPSTTSPPLLSPRQREIMELLCLGRTDAEIGRALGLSLDGVRTHTRAIYKKLGAHSRRSACEAWTRMLCVVDVEVEVL